MPPVGQRLKDLRAKKGWDQEELAYRAKVAGATVSKIECGRHNPRLDTLVQLAEALGVSVSELVAARRRPAVDTRKVA